MREQVRPTVLRPIEVAEELLPEPSGELAGLSPSVVVQSRLFDALVLLAAAREEAQKDAAIAWLAPAIGDTCHQLDRLLMRFSC